MSGSFWRFSNGFNSFSNVTPYLEDYLMETKNGNGLKEKTFSMLLKLLDENDLIQELLSNNAILLDYLRQVDVIDMLVDLVIDDGVIEGEVSQGVEQLNLDSDEKTDSLENEAMDEKNIDSHEKESEEIMDTSNKDEDLALAKKKFSEMDLVEEDIIENASDKDISENEEEVNDKQETATRRATLATEILSADVWSLTDTVMECTESLNRLWSILDAQAPLSLSLSTYFMKIMEHLLDMKCDEMINYLVDHQPNLVAKFIKHLSNPPLMDFLLKLISTDKPDNSTGIIDFLQKQNLISLLIDALDLTEGLGDAESDLALVKQSSAADFLKALITISANSTTDSSNIGPNELTRELVSYDMMERLCNIMIKGDYALANGVGIIIEIIRKNNSDYDILPVLYINSESHPPTGRDPIYLGDLLMVFGKRIGLFAELLNRTDNLKKLETPFGTIERLGFERFKICELIAELLHCSNMALLNDTRGYDVVKARDELRLKMKEYDPVSFKYNEVITLPDKERAEDEVDESYVNDTIDSFNANLQEDESLLRVSLDTDEEPHANANMTEEQLRKDTVVGDFLKIALYDTLIISSITSMFYEFPWNNFLHNVVFDIVQQVLNGSIEIGFNKYLAIDIFNRCDITNQIVRGQYMCEEYEKSHNNLRLGYMGHLTLIAEEVVKFTQVYPLNTISEIIEKKFKEKAWEDYVNDILYDTREKYNSILGRSEEDGEGEEDISDTFNEASGDVIGTTEVKRGLNLDPNVDNDILTGDYEEETTHEEFRQEKESNSSDGKGSAADDSGSDDDDHFANYMSQQLTSTASTEVISPVDAQDEASVSDQTQLKQHEDDAFEDYIDPNDDGLSYARANSIYDSKGSFISMTDEVSSEDSSSDDDVDDDVDDVDEDDNKKARGSEKSAFAADSHENKLTRAASKG